MAALAQARPPMDKGSARQGAEESQMPTSKEQWNNPWSVHRFDGVPSHSKAEGRGYLVFTDWFLSWLNSL